jgi:hypothetical protein
MKRSLYEHVETKQRIELHKVENYYYSIDQRRYHIKEIRCLYKFLGYIHNRIIIKRNYEAHRNVNGFLIRSYKRKHDNSKA